MIRGNADADHVSSSQGKCEVEAHTYLTILFFLQVFPAMSFMPEATRLLPIPRQQAQARHTQSVHTHHGILAKAVT